MLMQFQLQSVVKLDIYDYAWLLNKKITEAERKIQNKMHTIPYAWHLATFKMNSLKFHTQKTININTRTK